MKHRPILDRFKPQLAFMAALPWPLLAALAGQALLVFAWKIPANYAWNNNKIILNTQLTLWVLAPLLFIGFCVYRHHGRALALRYVLVLCVFIWSFVPFAPNFYKTISSQSFSALGALLLLPGMLAARALHPSLRLASRIASVHRRLQPAQCLTLFALFFFSFTLFLSWYCFDFHPAYTDSTSQYVHGKFVASGHLFSIPGHPLREFFYVWLMVHADKWYSQYPPLHQTLLGLGHMINAPWLINPLEGTITLLAAYAVAKRAYGEGTARLACLLMLISPFVILMQAEFMNHSSALMFTTLVFYCHGRFLDAYAFWKKNPAGDVAALKWAGLMGLCAGLAFLARPLTAMGTCAPFIAHACWMLWRERKAMLKPFLMMSAGGILCILFQMWFNYETTGDMFVYAYTRYHANSLAGAMGWYKEGTVWKTILKMHSDWFWLNVNLFEWSLPCTSFIMLVALRPLKNLTTRLLLAVLFTQSFGNMFNQFSSTVFGPRYMYEVSSALIILTAHGVHRLPLSLRAARMRLPDRAATHGAVALFMLMVCATGLVNHFPNRIRDFSHFFDSHPGFIRSMHAQSEHPALIFVGRFDKDKKPPSDQAAHFRWTAWTNPPDDNAPVIFAGDRGDEKNKKLIQYYPYRKAYVEQDEKLTHIPGTPLLKPEEVLPTPP